MTNLNTQRELAQIKETVRFLPLQIEELRGDIMRLAESFSEELRTEKKSDRSMRELLSSLQLESPSLREEGGRASQIQDRLLPGRGLLSYLK